MPEIQACKIQWPQDEQLRVEAVLDGTVQRDADTLRVTARLLRVWTARCYGRENLVSNFQSCLRFKTPFRRKSQKR